MLINSGERIQLDELTDQLIQECLGDIKLSPGVIAAARAEFGRGLPYYDARIQRLSLTGERVLDAACGMGSWSLALARHFGQVHALGLDEEQLGVLQGICQRVRSNVTPLFGSIENLPYAHNTFDAIVCNRFVSLTDWKLSLQEFSRVLRSGGRLYLSFHTKYWGKHLISERAPQEPQRIVEACDAFLNRSFKLLDQIQFERICLPLIPVGANLAYSSYPTESKQQSQAFVRNKAALAYSSYPANSPTPELDQIQSPLWAEICTFLNRFRAQTDLFNAICELIESAGHVFEHGTTRQRWRLCRDLISRCTLGRPDYTIETQAHYFDPEEMVSALESIGFEERGSSWEGTLVVNTHAPQVSPIFAEAQGIYEILAVRLPSYEGHWPRPSFLIENSRQAASRFSRMHAYSWLADSSRTDLVERWIGAVVSRAGASFANQPVLKNLVVEVTRDARTEEDAFRLLFRFIQDSLFHHPTFLLRNERGGEVLDPIAILLSGIARCHQVSTVCCELFRILGHEARVTNLYKHVISEVLYRGRWLVADADLFKAGLHPTNEAGDWSTLGELQQMPWLLDELPSIGITLDPDAIWGQNSLGVRITGYVDSGLAWQRPYVSFLYFGGQAASPPKPPQMDFAWCPKGLRIRATHISDGTRRIRIHVDNQSRGWNYGDFPDERYLRQPQGNLHRGEYSPDELADGIIVPITPAGIFVNVYALDDYMLAHPKVFAWPDHEFKIEKALEV